MTDPFYAATLAVAGLLAVTILALAGLKAWAGWLDLQRLSLDGHRSEPGPTTGNSGARIELADLKERVRKLEAIAAGVDF